MTGEGIAKNRGGRPPERDEAKRAAISMRITPATRAALDAAAAQAGRSLAQEVEQRLERSIENEAAKGGPATAALIHAIVADIAEIEAVTGKSWATDNVTYAAVRRAVIAAIVDRPPTHVENEGQYRCLIEQANSTAKELVSIKYLLNLSVVKDMAEDIKRKLNEEDIPALESKFKVIQDAADVAYRPQLEAERAGRKLFAEIRQRRREARENRKLK